MNDTCDHEAYDDFPSHYFNSLTKCSSIFHELVGEGGGAGCIEPLNYHRKDFFLLYFFYDFVSYSNG